MDQTPEKDHPMYNLEELRKAFYVVSSLADEIETGRLTEDEIKNARGLVGDKQEAIDAIELVGHLLELYGA